MRTPLFCTILAFLCAGGGSLHAETVSFQQGVNGYSSTSDVWFNGNQAAPGATPSATEGRGWAGTSTQNPTWHMTVIKFEDIFGSGPNQVPLPASQLGTTTIESATLTLTHGRNLSSTWNAHRVLVDWSASPLDVSNFAGGEKVGPDNQSHGVEYELTPTGTATSVTPRNGSGTGTFSIDVTSDIQAFHDGTVPNYGWELTSGSDYVFLSNGSAIDDNSIAFLGSERPILSITFSTEPPLTPEPGSVVLWLAVGLGMAGTAWSRRRRRLT